MNEKFAKALLSKKINEIINEIINSLPEDGIDKICKYKLSDESKTYISVLEKLKETATPNIDITGNLVGSSYSLPTAPTDLFMARSETELLEAKKKAYISYLSKVSDEVSIFVRNFLNKVKLTDIQEKRYKYKYNYAVDFINGKNDGSNLNLESSLKGISTTELANIIVSMGNGFLNTMIKYSLMIDAYRVKVKLLIEAGDFTSAMNYIKIGKTLDNNTTQSDIENIFKSN